MARRVIQLSDLHFGRTDPAVIKAVRNATNALDPDLVVISGDLTQRAKKSEFLEAKYFLDCLTAPKLVVPGNHDVPLFNVWKRLFKGLKSYQKIITEDLSPVFEDEEIFVVGVNTARSLIWKSGRINEDQIAETRELLLGSTAPIKLVVSHHPFDLPNDFKDGKLVGRSKLAMKAFASCNVDMYLAGHFHLTSFSLISERFKAEGRSSLIVQAGTVSTRAKKEANSFNTLNFDSNQVTIEHYIWDKPARAFTISKTERFKRNPLTGWEPC